MMEKFDSHLHYTMDTLLSDSVHVFEKIFAWTGVTRALFASLPSHDPLMQNLKGLFYKQYFSPNAYALAGLVHHPQQSDEAQAKEYLRQAEEYAAAGFDGFKMLEGKPSLRKVYKYLLSDPVYDRFFAFAEENALPVTLHNADPATFWDLSKMNEYQIARGWYCDESLPTKDGMFEDVMAVMKRHPRLRLTMAHFGFTSDNIAQARAFLDRYEFTRLDTTPGGEQYFNMLLDKENWVDFLKSHAGRIKYGTDTYNYSPKPEPEQRAEALPRPLLVSRFLETTGEYEYYGESYRGIGLEPSLLRKIYMENALAEYGAPKSIDHAWIAGEIERLTPLCAENAAALADLRTIEKQFA